MMHATVSFAAAIVFAALAAMPAAVDGRRCRQSRSPDLPDFTELYDKQAPAVVSIDVTQKVRRSRGPELSEDDPFYEFFRRFGQIPRRGAARPTASSTSSRSARDSSFRATATSSPNAHVVDGADEVNVKLTDKREFKAKVIGADKRTGRGAPQDRGQGPAQGHDRRPGEAQGRRMGRRDRQAVRPREHDDGRHRQREGPRPAAGEPGPVHPDRCRGEPGQFRAGRCSTSEVRWSASTR